MAGIDVTAIVLKIVEIIPNFIPRPKAPKTDYSQLIEAVPKVKYPAADLVAYMRLKQMKYLSLVSRYPPRMEHRER